MKLEQYTSLGEKEKIFRGKYKRINSADEFDKWFSGNHGKYFRGINEASFKNYTSAQRLFITRDLNIHGITITDLVKEQVNSLKDVRNGLINSYYKDLLNREPSDLLLLSFAQHQKKGIAPLLDFTLDRRIALFFMIDGCGFSERGHSSPLGNQFEPIENYASLYYLTGRNKLAINNVLDDKLGPELLRMRKRHSEKLSQLGEKDDYQKYVYERNLRQNEFIIKNRFINNILSSDIKDIIIESPKEDDRKEGHILPRIMISNINITAQQGCFVYHNDGLNPFENLYCVDIHKSLIQYIRNKYLFVSQEKANTLPQMISKTIIYPDLGTIVEESINYALSQVVKG